MFSDRMNHTSINHVSSRPHYNSWFMFPIQIKHCVTLNLKSISLNHYKIIGMTVFDKQCLFLINYFFFTNNKPGFSAALRVTNIINLQFKQFKLFSIK